MENHEANSVINVMSIDTLKISLIQLLVLGQCVTTLSYNK